MAFDWHHLGSLSVRNGNYSTFLRSFALLRSVFMLLIFSGNSMIKWRKLKIRAI
ncbi:MAG: hypothetical protein ACI9IP_001872, partial [Arcticibacterium sp.]